MPQADLSNTQPRDKALCAREAAVYRHLIASDTPASDAAHIAYVARYLDCFKHDNQWFDFRPLLGGQFGADKFAANVKGVA